MKAYELFATPGTWCQNGFAQTARGNTVSAGHPGAVRFCIAGALIRTYRSIKKYDEIAVKVNRFLVAEGAKGLIEWNDEPGRNQGQVYALLKELDL